MRSIGVLVLAVGFAIAVRLGRMIIVGIILFCGEKVAAQRIGELEIGPVGPRLANDRGAAGYNITAESRH